jgi:hypothetical protein
VAHRHQDDNLAPIAIHFVHEQTLSVEDEVLFSRGVMVNKQEEESIHTWKQTIKSLSIE